MNWFLCPAEEIRRIHQLHKHRWSPLSITEASDGRVWTFVCQYWKLDCWQLLRSFSSCFSHVVNSTLLTTVLEWSLWKLYLRVKCTAPFARHGFRGRQWCYCRAVTFLPAQPYAACLPRESHGHCCSRAILHSHKMVRFFFWLCSNLMYM